MQEETPGRNKEANRKYYALFAPYGIRAVYNEHHAPRVHIFETVKARDDWISQDDPFNSKREAVIASVARKYLPKERDSQSDSTASRSVMDELNVNRADVAARPHGGKAQKDHDDDLR